MKWNWGSKLIIAIILFMGFIIGLVIMTTKNDVDLVEKDYYPKGLKYQDRVEQFENAAPFSDQVRIYPESSSIVVTFPEITPDTGTIVFFRPSDIDFDQIYKINPDSSLQMNFSKSLFTKGKYLVKIYWEQNQKAYYIEKPFYFN